jgi:hypothetical protein
MSWDPLIVANIAGEELGADIAEVRVPGLVDDDEYHLPGVDVLLAAGVTIASAFFFGFVRGVAEETGRWGEDMGAGLVRRFRALIHRSTTHVDQPSDTTATTVSPNDRASDLAVEFASLTELTRTELLVRHIEVATLKAAATQSRVEVARALVDLGVTSDRAETIAARTADRILDELLDGAGLSS